MSANSSVLLIYTGGTIGMVQEPESGKLKPFDFDHLLEQVPELKKFKTKISTLAFEKPIDSSDMSPEIWIKIAKIIEKNYDKHDGFVVLHGSDTMAFTASALSFLLEGLNKPVVLTGSQIPIGVIRTDGKENLITAIEIAADKHEGKGPVVSEVCIYFEYALYRGNRTFKLNSEHFDAFRSGNYPKLAEAGVNIDYHYSALKASNSQQKLRAHEGLNSNIAELFFYPGIALQNVEAVLRIRDLKGLIIHTFGSGNASTNPKLIELLENAIKKGLIVLNITQCKIGRVEQGMYETSVAFNRIGVVSGGDMTREAAITKMMFLLAQGLSNEDVKMMLSKNLRGELTE